MEFYILGDAHHGNPKVVNKIKDLIEKLSKGKRTALLTEIFMIDEQDIIERTKKEPAMLDKVAGEYRPYLEFCVKNEIDIYPISPRNEKIGFVYWRMPEEELDIRLFSNFSRKFREIGAKYEVYLIDIGSSHVKAFEEQFKDKYKEYPIKSFIVSE
ncbi:MAG: hypothetical protein ACUVUG_01415 [Candidatus Aminicenantia bacterium]